MQKLAMAIPGRWYDWTRTFVDSSMRSIVFSDWLEGEFLQRGQRRRDDSEPRDESAYGHAARWLSAGALTVLMKRLYFDAVVHVNEDAKVEGWRKVGKCGGLKRRDWD
jgi:hypothetical protein